MAWLGEGLSSLKGQITSFTKEVLSDGKEDGSDASDITVLQEKVRDLESYCASQDLEISELRERNQQLQVSLNGGHAKASATEVAGSDDLQYVPTTDSWSSWDQPGFQPQYGPATFKELPTSPEKGNVEGKDQYLKDQVGHLEAENNLMKRMCSELEDQVAELSEQLKTISSKDQDSKQLEASAIDHQNRALQLQKQLQASELRVRELESQLRAAQEELLDQLVGSQKSTSQTRSDLEQTRKTRLAPEFEAKQRGANKLREIEVAKSNLEELRSQGKHVTSDIVAIIQNLGNHEQQELIHGALDALELENQVLKLRNAELEMQAGSLKDYNMDLDVGYKVDHFGDDESEFPPHSFLRGPSARSTSLDGQIDHLANHERSENINANWSAEKRILEKQCSELKAQLKETENNLILAMAHKGLLEVQKQTGDDDDVPVSPNSEMEAVRIEREQLITDKRTLKTELEALEMTVQDLEAKMTTVLEENSALTGNLEELDQQHQVVIEQLLAAKKTAVKENETLMLELTTLKQQLEEVPVTKQSIDNTTDTCDLTENNEVLYQEYKKTFDEEFSENIMQLVTFDLPNARSSTNTEELKSTSLLRSILKTCEESKWKKDTLERKVAEVMKEVRDTQRALTERDKTIAQLHQELTALKENEEVLIKELMGTKDNSGECLASIPENSEEVEALEQRVALLEEQLRDKAMLENEIARLREERAVIARKFHIAEASLDNEENFQICTGHELQQALQGNEELQRENSTLLSKIQSLEVVENHHKEMQEKCLSLQELLAGIENELSEARKMKSLLEIDVETKSDSLQQALNVNIKLQEQNNANLVKIKSQEELIKTYDHFEVECARLQKLITDKEEELQKALDGTTPLNYEFSVLSDRYQELVQANAELVAEHTSLVSQVKTQEDTLKNSVNLYEEVSSLQKELDMKQMELNEVVSKKYVLETDLATLTERFERSEEEKVSNATTARDMEELVQSKLKLESEIVQREEKYQVLKTVENSLRNEISDLKNTSETLGTQMETVLLEKEMLMKHLTEKETQCSDLLAAQSITNEECVGLQSQLAAKSAEIESMLEAMSLIKGQNEDRDASLAAESESKKLEDQALMSHEVDRWKEMVSATERQLNEALQARAELEAECGRLFAIETKVHDQECLQRETSRLTGVLESTEQRLTEALDANEQLEQACMMLRVELDDKKGLNEEISKWKEQCSFYEHELQNQLSTNQKLEEECHRLFSELTKMESAHSEAIQWKDMHANLQEQFDDLSETKSILEAQLASMQKKLQGLHKTEDELNEWKEKVRVTECQLHEALMKKLELEREFENREEASNNNEKMDQEKPHKDDKDVDESLDGDGTEEVDTLISAEDTIRQGIKEQIHHLQAERDRMLSILEEKTRENGSLKAENHHLMQIVSAEKVSTNKLQEEKVETLIKHDIHSSDTSMMAKETISNLSEIIKTKDVENEGLTQKCTSLVKLLQDVEDSSSKQLSRLMVERDELIRTVQLKHQESLQYHGEIQRLSGLLNQELGRNEQIRLQFEDKQKMLLNTQNELIAVKQRLDKLEQAAGTGIKADQVFISRQSTNMEVSTENKEVEVMEPLSKQEHSQSLGEGMSSQNIAVPSQDSHEAMVQKLKAEHAQLLDRIQQEATRNLYLQNEVQEQHEKEGALMRELERLRLHLVAVEESYTHEAVTTENQIRDLQSKLSLAEERIKSCSTALTSASVRANQHVESLQGQTRLIGQQRDDVQAKLSAAEDQIQRHVAALTNLQAVLEQFQRDKEQEETAAKARLHRQLQAAEDRRLELVEEVASLRSQLLEAKDGLSAAARLGEQLDRKTQVITELKEEVNRLQGLLKTAEKREESASLNAEGKVDRYLLKNLLLGYLSAPNNTKPQALRILGTVLDFNLEERGRAGLEPGSVSGGWLHSLLHPGTGTASGQSLSEAFIRFLESESRPQPQLRLLPTLQEQQQQQQQQQQQHAGVSESPVPSGRSPILLTEVQLPTFTQFPVPRSSSSILKDVLKDS